MSKKIRNLLEEQSEINLAGILVVVVVGGVAGVAFASGNWQWGLIVLLAAGLFGLAIAWIRNPKR